MKYEPDTNIRDFWGHNILDIALGASGSQVNLEVVKILLNNKTDVNTMNERGNTALMKFNRSCKNVEEILDLIKGVTWLSEKAVQLLQGIVAIDRTRLHRSDHRDRTDTGYILYQP